MNNKNTLMKEKKIIKKVSASISHFQDFLNLFIDIRDIHDKREIRSMVILNDGTHDFSRNWLYNQWGPTVLDNPELQRYAEKWNTDMAHLLWDGSGIDKIRQITILAFDDERQKIAEKKYDIS